MSSRVSSFARSTANRAIHLFITPRPANIGESREIFRLISQFGEIEYFKSLKYDALPSPNTALVIFKEEEAASYCLKRSPIRFRMGRATQAAEANSGSVNEPARTEEPAETAETPSQAQEKWKSARGPSGGAFGLSQSRSLSTSSLPNPPRPPPPMPLIEPSYKAPEPQSRIFQIQTNPARIRFRDQINMGHYHGRFAVRDDIAQEDLAKRVPIVGLSCIDWKAEDKPWRVMQKEQEREHKGPSRRRSMRELYEEGPGKAGAWRDEAMPSG